MAQERESACYQLRQIVIQPSYMHHGTHTCTHIHTQSHRHSESETNVIFKKTQHFFCSTGSVTWPEYTTHTASLSDICQVRGDFYGLCILNGQDTFMNRESTKTFDPLNVPGFVGFSQSREQWTIFPGHLRRWQRNWKLSPEYLFNISSYILLSLSHYHLQPLTCSSSTLPARMQRLLSSY